MKMPNNKSNNSRNEYRGLLDDEIVSQAQAALVQEDDSTDYGQQRGSNQMESGTKRQVSGAAVAGGIAGFLLVGPVVGLVLAGGAAVCAKSRGTAGDVARSGGEMVATAGDRLKRLDQKHHVVQKTSRGVVEGCHWVSHKLQPSRTETQTQLIM